jgi:hypothetical protein
LLCFAAGQHAFTTAVPAFTVPVESKTPVLLQRQEPHLIPPRTVLRRDIINVRPSNPTNAQYWLA